MEDQGRLFGTIGCSLVIAALLVILGASFYVFMLKVDTHVQPAVKDNKLHNADASMSNVNRYHNDVKNIITADNNLVTQLNQAKALKAANPSSYEQDSRYTQIIAIQLPGLDQIRHAAIAQYNADVSNTNINMDLPQDFPRSIADQGLPADPGEAVTLLQTQVQQLQTISGGTQ